MPSENVRQACGSRSTRRTDSPSSPRAAPIDATDVVLATPPFWLATARTTGPGVVDIVTHHARHTCPERACAGWLRCMSPEPIARGARPLALVTGPTSGLGRLFADRLARRGYDVVLVARDEARLKVVADELATSYGVSSEVLVADLTDREQLRRVEQRVADRGHPVDLLVNNAGFGLKGTFLLHGVEDEQALLDVLVTAPLR